MGGRERERERYVEQANSSDAHQINKYCSCRSSSMAFQLCVCIHFHYLCSYSFFRDLHLAFRYTSHLSRMALGKYCFSTQIFHDVFFATIFHSVFECCKLYVNLFLFIYPNVIQIVNLKSQARDFCFAGVCILNIQAHTHTGHDYYCLHYFYVNTSVWSVLMGNGNERCAQPYLYLGFAALLCSVLFCSVFLFG